jgi:hypothetical protein
MLEWQNSTSRLEDSVCEKRYEKEGFEVYLINEHTRLPPTARDGPPKPNDSIKFESPELGVDVLSRLFFVMGSKDVKVPIVWRQTQDRRRKYDDCWQCNRKPELRSGRTWLLLLGYDNGVAIR